MDKTVVLHTDGASRGNPGPAGIGVVVEQPAGTVVKQIARALGKRTNNQAEYEAVIAGLRAAHDLRARRVRLVMDSELVARQLRGDYRVKDAKLKTLYETARQLIAGFEQAQIVHVPRERNRLADRLANEAIDGRIGA